MLDLKSALVIVGIIFLILAWIMYSGDMELAAWFPWLFAGAGAALLLSGTQLEKDVGKKPRA